MSTYIGALALLAAALIQASVLPVLMAFDFRPEPVLLLVVSWSMIRGWRGGIWWALLGGLLLDVLSAYPIGTNAAGLIVAASLASLATLNPLRSGLFLPVATVFICSLVYHLLLLLSWRLTGHEVAIAASLVRSILPGAALNALLVPLFYVGIYWWMRGPVASEMK